ncbi:MAG: hypothetical protein A2076_14260 [Geobacteraceae bacterium GWC2_53_11]|nr:MAG: hypothetical protein A2076_14260 [Geobacteraceae bacterium GWC2_53_11]
MPKGSRTTLFVSSTCYDLAQLRTDLRDFAESMGLEPMLSELDTFPVDPSRDTVENCIDAVRTRADVFLLVVGGRYGSINDTGKSITNLEYLEAAARGIPKYVFVKSEILSLLPIWRDNPDADFSSTVDTPKLFEFVSHLRDNGEVWVFPFNNVQDITSTLRKQLSYLLADCLEIRSKMLTVEVSSLQLGPESLRIFVEKPKGWEYLVFAKLLQERIRLHEHKKLDAELGISFGPVIDLLDRPKAFKWVSGKCAQASQTVQHLSLALNSGIEKAVGEPGEPGDIHRIVHLASRIADGYSQILDWTLEFSRLNVEPELKNLMALAGMLSASMLNEIETYASSLYDKICEVIASPPTDNIVKFTLTFTAPDTTDFFKEMERLQLSS